VVTGGRINERPIEGKRKVERIDAQLEKENNMANEKGISIVRTENTVRTVSRIFITQAQNDHVIVLAAQSQGYFTKGSATDQTFTFPSPALAEEFAQAISQYADQIEKATAAGA
jgi:uncharacterized lipoprotein